MVRRTVLFAFALALPVPGLAACSGGHSHRAAVSPSTTASSTTGTTAAAPSSRDPLALGLDRALLSATELQVSLHLPAQPASWTGLPGDPPVPQGPLSRAGILAVLPSAAVYQGPFDEAQGSVGANHAYQDRSGTVIDILAAKFGSGALASAFVAKAIGIAQTFAQATADRSPDLSVGVLPAASQVVLHVPARPGDSPALETAAVSVAYPNGVTFVLTELGTPGTLHDASMIALARAQDQKYQAVKASTGTG